MAYIIQGDEYELTADMRERLARVIAESEALTLADAMYRLRSCSGMLHFEDRSEAERVAARFSHMGFANFVVDELLRPPRPRLLGLGAPLPKERMELVGLGRVRVDRKTQYWLDLLTREERWRARSGAMGPIVEIFTAVDVSGARLSAGVRSLSRSDREVPTFADEAAYEKHLTWLYQLRFA